MNLVLCVTSTAQAAQLTLSWDANTVTPDGYRIFQRTEGTTYDYSLPTWSGTATSGIIDNLSEGNTYYFTVRAYTGANESIDSNEISYLVNPGPQTQVTLSWDANSVTPDGYLIFQRTEGTAYDYSLPIWSGTTTSGTIDNLSEGNTYYFTVRAYIGANESIDSNEISYLVNPVPQAPVPQAQVTLSWDANATAPDGYRLFQRTQSSNYDYNSPVWSGTDTTYAAAGLTAGETYYFVVRAYNGDLESLDSNEITVQAQAATTTTSTNTTTATSAVTTFTVTAATAVNGTITPSGTTTLDESASQTYSIAPNAGFHIDDVRIDGISIGEVSTYTFEQVSDNHTISASFAETRYAVTALASGNGTISPLGSVSVAANGSQAFSIIADSNYNVDDVLIDGNSIGAVNSYTFSQVTANHTIEAIFTRSNQVPVADAGPDQMVNEAQVVTLSALNSIDADDGIAEFQWRQIEGPTVVLESPVSEETTFTAPDVGTDGAALVFELTVTDYSGASATDSCIVNVSWVNMPPTARAGEDQTVAEGTEVILDAAASSDPDNGIATFKWRQIQGPAVTLSDGTAAQPSFQAPQVGPEGASILFELTVTDGGGLQDTDACMITIESVNSPPVANAGVDLETIGGGEVTLNGSQSTDPDDGIASYQWRQTEGSPVALSDTTAISPVFTAPSGITEVMILTFELTVTDNGGLQSSDNCQVLVTPESSTQIDTTPPEVMIFDPTDMVEVKQPKVTIYGSAWDDVAVDRILWENDQGGSGMAEGTTQWKAVDLRLKRGLNTFTITVYDTTGNQASSIVRVIRK